MKYYVIYVSSIEIHNFLSIHSAYSFSTKYLYDLAKIYQSDILQLIEWEGVDDEGNKEVEIKRVRFKDLRVREREREVSLVGKAEGMSVRQRYRHIPEVKEAGKPYQPEDYVLDKVEVVRNWEDLYDTRHTVGHTSCGGLYRYASDVDKDADWEYARRMVEHPLCVLSICDKEIKFDDVEEQGETRITSQGKVIRLIWEGVRDWEGYSLGLERANDEI